MADVDYRMRAVIDDGRFSDSDTLGSVHNSRAPLRREQLDRAECTLRAECVAPRDAAPEHDVDTSEHLPGKLVRRWSAKLQIFDQLVKEVGVNGVAFPLSELVPVIRAHFHLHVTARTDLRHCDEIIECGLASGLHREEPLELRPCCFRREERIKLVLIKRMTERRVAIPLGEC